MTHCNLHKKIKKANKTLVQNVIFSSLDSNLSKEVIYNKNTWKNYFFHLSLKKLTIKIKEKTFLYANRYC